MEARKLNPLEPQEATSPPQLPAREVAEIWIKSSEKTGPKKKEETIDQKAPSTRVKPLEQKKEKPIDDKSRGFFN